MKPATPQMRHLAERLIAHQPRGSKSPETRTHAAFNASEKLRPHLATLMGNTGFRALLTRALALASAEAPYLRTVRVKADGYLDGLDELEAREARGDLDTIAEGGVVLLAQLLGLLVAFIGEALTMRIVREAWPQLSANDLVLTRGVRNETDT